MSPSAPPSERRELVVLGVIGKPRGLAGDVYVKASNPDSSLWESGSSLLLAPPRDEREPDGDTFEATLDDLSLVTVARSGRGAKRRLVVRFAEVAGRDDAETLNGWRIATDRELFEAPEDPDEFWLVEMPGWLIADETGSRIGVVVDTMQTHIDLLEVRPAAGGDTFYLPMISDVVVQLDRPAKTVVIRRMPGLIPGDDA